MKVTRTLRFIVHEDAWGTARPVHTGVTHGSLHATVAEPKSERPRGLRACLLSGPLLKTLPAPWYRRAGVWEETASVPRLSPKDPYAGIS